MHATGEDVGIERALALVGDVQPLDAGGVHELLP